MRTLLTVLILLIGVYGYPYTNPHVAPSPQFRYIDLGLQPHTVTQSQPTYYENYNYSTSPQQETYRNYSSISFSHTNLSIRSDYTTLSSTILIPFSETISEDYPITNISTRGWGDGEEDEPGLDPYPIGEGLSFLFLCILIYTIISIYKIKNNHHEKSF